MPPVRHHISITPNLVGEKSRDEEDPLHTIILPFDFRIVTKTLPVTLIVTQVQTATVTSTLTAFRTITLVPPRTLKAGNLPSKVDPTISLSSISSPTITSSSSTSLSISLATTTPSSSSFVFSSSTTHLSPSSAPASHPSSILPSSSLLPPLTSSLPNLPSPSSRSALPDQSNLGKSLSSGAVAGIVISCVLFTLLLIICLVRQRFRRKRQKTHKWITPFVVEKPTIRASVNHRQEKRKEFLAERWQRIRSSRNGERAGQSSRGTENNSNVVGGREVTRRDGGHRHRRRVHVPAPPSVYRGPSARRPVRDNNLLSSLFPHGAVAKLDFEPTRRDELLVRSGDYLRVFVLYDDGWALCKNNSGEKGMVPTACLRVNDMRRVG